VRPGTLEREPEQLGLRLSDDRRRASARRLDGREDRAGTGEQPELARVGRIAVGRDERYARPRHVGGVPDVIETHLGIPRDNHRLDAPRLVRWDKAFAPQQLTQGWCGAQMHTVATPETDPPEVRQHDVARRDDVARLGRDAHAHQLDRVLSRRPRSVVRHEDDLFAFVAQPRDRPRRSGDRLFAAPHHTVEVEEEGVESVGELHAGSARRSSASNCASARS
jgi:hypothetical protein